MTHYGIDDTTFIFASFGQSVKISKDMFKVWLNLLKNKNNSILWLLESNAHAHENLKAYAREYGIDSDRIIFADKVEFQEHISRHTIIDLFLDTYPYNAHTSASDALWAGCPILTMSGDTEDKKMFTAKNIIFCSASNIKNYKYFSALKLDEYRGQVDWLSDAQQPQSFQ